MSKLKISGLMLIIIGVGIPLLALIVTFPVYGLFYPSDQYLFTIGPIIILAVWLLPLVGGFCALKRKKWKLTLTGSIAAICYIPPCAYILVGLIRYYEPIMLPMIILFCLLLLITVLAIPATAFVVMSKNEFE